MRIEIDFNDEEFERLELLCDKFNMTQEQVINYLIFKQCYFHLADHERKASQIEANEN